MYPLFLAGFRGGPHVIKYITRLLPQEVLCIELQHKKKFPCIKIFATNMSTTANVLRRGTKPLDCAREYWWGVHGDAIQGLLVPSTC